MTRHYWKRWMHVLLKSPLKAYTERQQEGEKSTAQEAQKKSLTLAWSGREAQRRGRERKETRVLYLWTLFFSSAFICGCISEVSISQTYTPFLLDWGFSQSLFYFWIYWLGQFLFLFSRLKCWSRGLTTVLAGFLSSFLSSLLTLRFSVSFANVRVLDI